MRYQDTVKSDISVLVAVNSILFKLNILIINGSGVIGSVIVGEFQSSGANLIITSNSGDEVQGNETIKWRYDGSSSVDDLFEIIKVKYETIDSVVNCLGISRV